MVKIASPSSASMTKNKKNLKKVLYSKFSTPFPYMPPKNLLFLSKKHGAVSPLFKIKTQQACHVNHRKWCRL